MFIDYSVVPLPQNRFELPTFQSFILPAFSMTQDMLDIKSLVSSFQRDILEWNSSCPLCQDTGSNSRSHPFLNCSVMLGKCIRCFDIHSARSCSLHLNIPNGFCFGCCLPRNAYGMEIHPEVFGKQCLNPANSRLLYLGTIYFKRLNNKDVGEGTIIKKYCTSFDRSWRGPPLFKWLVAKTNYQLPNVVFLVYWGRFILKE